MFFYQDFFCHNGWCNDNKISFFNVSFSFLAFRSKFSVQKFHVGVIPQKFLQPNEIMIPFPSFNKQRQCNTGIIWDKEILRKRTIMIGYNGEFHMLETFQAKFLKLPWISPLKINDTYHNFDCWKNDRSRKNYGTCSFFFLISLFFHSNYHNSMEKEEFWCGWASVSLENWEVSSNINLKWDPATVFNVGKVNHFISFLMVCFNKPDIFINRMPECDRTCCYQEVNPSEALAW